MPRYARNASLCAAVAVLACGCHQENLRTEHRTTARASTPAGARVASPIAGKSQLVTVVTPSWNDFRATLRRFERVDAEGGPRWKAVGDPFDVVLGRNGYGWGRGLHGDGRPEDRGGPTKHEGDGKSPAGVFAIGEAYGYAPAREDLALPYAQATAELRCVDDSESKHYNRIVSISDTDVDWRSAEHMRRDDALYVLTIVVEHNIHDTEPGAGSCIFIHLWDGPDQGMTGCTAMPLDALEALARWLRPGAAALVALPRSEYEALRQPWRLP
jgi:D-alanyl-D-alanine dipeptidase